MAVAHTTARRAPLELPLLCAPQGVQQSGSHTTAEQQTTSWLLAATHQLGGGGLDHGCDMRCCHQLGNAAGLVLTRMLTRPESMQYLFMRSPCLFSSAVHWRVHLHSMTAS